MGELARVPEYLQFPTRAIVLASLVAELAKALDGKGAHDSVSIASSADATALDFCLATDHMRSTLRLQVQHQPGMTLQVNEPTTCFVSRRLLQQVLSFASVPGCLDVMLWCDGNALWDNIRALTVSHQHCQCGTAADGFVSFR